MCAETLFKLKLNTVLVCMTILLAVPADAWSQDKNSWEVGVFGVFVYHLVDEDAAVAPDKPLTEFNIDLRLAYYRNPVKVISYYTSLNLGIGLVKRGFPETENFLDRAFSQDLVFGFTFNPAHSKRLWFNFGAGLNRLIIQGEPDYYYVSSGGITFTGSHPWTRMLNNMITSGSGVVKGYEEFERLGLAADIGMHLRLSGKFYFYGNYKPVYAFPLRHDYNAGFSFIF